MPVSRRKSKQFAFVMTTATARQLTTLAKSFRRTKSDTLRFLIGLAYDGHTFGAFIRGVLAVPRMADGLNGPLNVRSIASLLKKLEEADATGLDLSPGDPLAKEAAATIQSLLFARPKQP